MTATVVLVHGAWHSSWCWHRIVSGLEERGVPVLAVDLPGHGAHPGPQVEMAGDAAAVRAVLDGIDGEVVLLGHSYGGVVAGHAGDHPSVAHLVFLAALQLEVGESGMRAAAAEPEAHALDHTGRPDLGAALRPGDDPELLTVDPAAAKALFYGCCDDATTAEAIGHLGPQRMANLGEEATVAAWRDRPSTYVVCTRDGAIHPGLQRILARRATNTVEWDTDHSPFLSTPGRLVDLLAELAG